VRNNQSLEAILRSVREQAAEPEASSSSAIEKLSDHSLLQFYDSIRHHVDLDRSLGIRFVGLAAKQRAEMLRAELKRRGVSVSPIARP
jgi:hypothetical protein